MIRLDFEAPNFDGYYRGQPTFVTGYMVQALVPSDVELAARPGKNGWVNVLDTTGGVYLSPETSDPYTNTNLNVTGLDQHTRYLSWGCLRMCVCISRIDIQPNVLSSTCDFYTRRIIPHQQ